jgi:hypothetical protein
VCVHTHTHTHIHTQNIQIALIAGGASLAFIVLSASLVAMYLRNRKIYREYSVLKEQNEAELELDRIGACVWSSCVRAFGGASVHCTSMMRVCVSVSLCLCVKFHSLLCTAGLRFRVWGVVSMRRQTLTQGAYSDACACWLCVCVLYCPCVELCVLNCRCFELQADFPWMKRATTEINLKAVTPGECEGRREGAGEDLRQVAGASRDRGEEKFSKGPLNLGQQ